MWQAGLSLQDLIESADSASTSLTIRTTYRPDVAHAIINAGRHEAMLFLVVNYR